MNNHQFSLQLTIVRFKLAASKLLRHSGTQALRHSGTLVLRHLRTLALRHSGTQELLQSLIINLQSLIINLRFPLPGLLAFCSLLFTLPAMTAHAQDSLSVYLETAAKNNPQLKAQFLEYSAALEKVPQAGSLPDPQATFGFFTRPMELMGGDQAGNVELMQMFPWFGTLKTAKDEASLMARAKFEAFNAGKAELFYQVKASWYRLMRYDREIDLIRENIELLESLEKLALMKFQSPGTGNAGPAMQGGSMEEQFGSMNGSTGKMNGSAGRMGSGMNNMANQGASNTRSQGNTSSAMQEGMGSPQSGMANVLRVRMEILEQQNRLALLTDQRRTEEAGFNALLNRAAGTPVQTADSLMMAPLPANKLAIADSILRNNPMLTMLENETASYAAMEEKAKKMGLPMLGVGLNYMLIQKREENMSMMNGKDMVMPMVAVSIPIYRKKYRSMQNEARLMQQAGSQRSADLKNNLLVEYRRFVQDLDDAKRRVTLYREQEELARKTTDLLISGFATTGNDYEEVIRMQLKVLDYGFKHIEAITDYNTSVAMAEKLMNALD